MGKKKVALFIDAENINASYAKFVFDNASVYGKIPIKRIYADWENGSNKQWKDAIAKYSIKAIQCPCFVSKKNSSDMFLMADALEALYETNIQTFIIVSSDSDYLPLVQKLKEKGKKTLGFGTQKAIQPYVNSFDKFIYFAPKQKPQIEKKREVEQKQELKQQQEKPTQTTQQTQDNPPKQEKPQEQNLLQDSTKIINEMIKIIDELIKTKEKATYSHISTETKKKYPNFKPKNYGYPTLRKLIYGKILSQSQKYKEKRKNSDFYLVKNSTKWSRFLLKLKPKALMRFHKESQT